MDHIENRIVELIDKNRERILEFGRDIYTHAEVGYKEQRTAAKFLEQMESLGLDTEKGIAITGVKARVNTGNPGPCLALLGEMDGLPLQNHRFTNPETGAAHVCGHNCQLTGVLGAAIALTDPEVLASLSGSLVFLGVPAEEYTNLDYKGQLQNEGKIGYLCGKGEMIRVGAFDDIDLCIANHCSHEVSLGNGSSNGFFSKRVTFYGKSSHAAAAPDQGINALSAASLALQAIGLNREMFPEKEKICINTVLTEGGTAPGMIPDFAQIEAMVRGNSIEAMEKASKIADRCFLAGAKAMGAGIRIETSVGFLPEEGAPPIPELVQAARELLPDTEVLDNDWTNHILGSSDLGDLGSVVPTLKFRTDGIKGGLHGIDFDISDEDKAYIQTAKLFAVSAYRLLRNGAALANTYLQNTSTIFSGREEYCAYIDSKHTVYEELLPESTE